MTQNLNDGNDELNEVLMRFTVNHNLNERNVIKLRNQIKQYIIDSKSFLSDGDFDPVVRVVELGGSSIDIMIVAYAPKMGFAPFNELKEALIFKIIHIIEDNGSEFAYPSTSLYVESMPE